MESFLVWRYFQTTPSRRIRQVVHQASLTPSCPIISFLQKRSLAKRLEKRSLNYWRTILRYGFKFICYRGPADAAKVTWNIHRDHNTNQFLWNFVFFAKTVTNFFHVFIFHKKCPISSRISTSSFDEQDVLWIRLW